MIVIARDPEVRGNSPAEMRWNQLQRQYLRLSPNSEFVIAAGSGHDVPLAKPDIVVNAVRKLHGHRASSREPAASRKFLKVGASDVVEILDSDLASEESVAIDSFPVIAPPPALISVLKLSQDFRFVVLTAISTIPISCGPIGFIAWLPRKRNLARFRRSGNLAQ